MNNPESSLFHGKDNTNKTSRRGFIRGLGALAILSLFGKGDASDFNFEQPPSNYPKSSESPPEKALFEEEKLVSQTIEEIKKQAIKIFEVNNCQDLMDICDRVESYRDTVETYANQFGIDPEILLGIIFIESKGDPNPKNKGINDSGAVGLCQFLPKTADEFKLDDRTNPEQSIRAAVEYLIRYKNELGTNDIAMASFHMGCGNMKYLIEQLATENEKQLPACEIVKRYHLDYPKIYFAAKEEKNPEAYDFLFHELKDDSAHYYFKVLAAIEILKLNKLHPVGIKMGSEKFYKEI